MRDSETSIAILSVSAGAGHTRAAEALEAAAQQYYPTIRVKHYDLMEMVPKLFRKMYVDGYLKIVDRHPALWGFLYHKTDEVRPDDSRLKRLRTSIEQLNTHKLSTTLDELQPDKVICTHFLPAELMARMHRKGQTTTPCWVTVTDFDVHALWVHSRMEGYFAASDEVAWRMRDRGIPAERIHVTGIPIMPVFGQRPPRAECAKELGIDADLTTILLMSGGLGVGDIHRLAERLLTLPGDFQIIALAGKNAELLQRLQQLAANHPGRLWPMGFTRTIERVMAVSDIAVTKPGGLTTSECLAMGLPMIIVSPIPGQEERNADYLLEHGAALKAHDEAGLEYRVRELLREPAKLRQMRENAHQLARPGAARRVLETVLGRS